MGGVLKSSERVFARNRPNPGEEAQSIGVEVRKWACPRGWPNLFHGGGNAPSKRRQRLQTNKRLKRHRGIATEGVGRRKKRECDGRLAISSRSFFGS